MKQVKTRVAAATDDEQKRPEWQPLQSGSPYRVAAPTENEEKRPGRQHTVR